MKMRWFLAVLAGVLALVVRVSGQNGGAAVVPGGAPPDAGTVPRVAPEPAAPAARIAFGSVNHDFGRVESGQVVRHDFVYTNTGNATLEIREVRPGCGCTTAGTWDKRVEPGQTGRIPIGFNSGSFGGTVTKSIFVSCNDPGQSNVYLQIKASIWTPISISPSTAYFNLTSETTTNESKVIRIVSNLDEPLKLSEPEFTNSSFTATLKTVTPGKEFDLLISPVLPLASTYASTVISMKTSSEKSPVLRVQATAMLQPVVSVVPSMVMLPELKVPGAAKPAVTVRNTGTAPLTLSNAKVKDIPGATVEVKELQPGRVFRLTFDLPPEVKLEPGQRVEATVETSHPKHAQLSIPIVPAPRSTRPAANATISAPIPARTLPAGQFPGPVTK